MVQYNKIIKNRKKGFTLVERNSEYTVEQIQEATEATLHVAPNLKEMVV